MVTLALGFILGTLFATSVYCIVCISADVEREIRNKRKDN